MNNKHMEELLLETKKLNPFYEEAILEKLKGFTFEDKSEPERAALAFGYITAISRILVENVFDTAQGDRVIIAIGMDAYKNAFLASMLSEFHKKAGMDVEEYFSKRE